MSSDVNLWIEQSRGGDREAFARIVAQFQAKVCAVTFSMTGRLQESEDIAQETFLTAWNKLGELREPEKIGAWLCGIARTLCKKWYDRNRRDPLHAAAPVDRPGLEPVEASASDEHEKRQEQADLAWSVLADIPEQYREPLVHYYREGRSVREVAETLELTETCVKQRLHRGRQHLKKELERLVESALESTRPDTAFTLAVLAAIPLAASAGCSATSKSIGVLGGVSAMGWSGSVLAVLGCLVCLLFNSTMMIVLAAVCFYAFWYAVKNSPTLRTRRFVIEAALDFNLLIWLCNGMAAKLLLSMPPLVYFADGFRKILAKILFLCFQSYPGELKTFVWGLPYFCLFFAFVLYAGLRWRQLLYEERQPSEPLEGDSPLDNVRRFIGRWQKYFLTAHGIKVKRNIVVGLIAVAIALNAFSTVRFISSIAAEEGAKDHVGWLYGTSAWFFGIQLVIQLAFFRLVSHGMAASRDETALETTPPKYKFAAWDLEDVSPAARRGVLRDALFLWTVIPLSMMLGVVGLGFLRISTNDPIFSFGTGLLWSVDMLNFGPFHMIARIEFVLIALTALWISGKPDRRYSAYAKLFLWTGLLTVGMIEWGPLVLFGLMPLIYQYFFSGAAGGLSDIPGWVDFNFGVFIAHQKSALLYHLFAAGWLVYSLIAATVCSVLARRAKKAKSRQ